MKLNITLYLSVTKLWTVWVRTSAFTAWCNGSHIDLNPASNLHQPFYVEYTAYKLYRYLK